MNQSASALLDYLHEQYIAINPAFRREVLRLSLQALMEWEVSSTINAGHYERVGERKTYRNGYRPRAWRSVVGEVDLYIPKLRQGTYNPDFLRDVEPAILKLSERLFIDDLQQSDIRALCQQAGLIPMDSAESYELTDTLTLAADRARRSPLKQRFTSLWLDTIPTPNRQEIKIAAGIDQNNQAELLTFSADPITDWHDLLGDLVERGLRNVDTVLTAPQVYIQNAIGIYLPGVNRQISAAADLPHVQFAPLAQAGMWADEALYLELFSTINLQMGSAWVENQPIMAIGKA